MDLSFSVKTNRHPLSRLVLPKTAGWTTLPITLVRGDLSPAAPFQMRWSGTFSHNELTIAIRLKNTGVVADTVDLATAIGQIVSSGFSVDVLGASTPVTVLAGQEIMIREYKNSPINITGLRDLLVIAGTYSAAVPNVFNIVSETPAPPQPINPGGLIGSVSFSNTSPSRDQTVTVFTTIENTTARTWLFEISGEIWANLGYGYAKQGNLWDRPLGGTATSPIIGSAQKTILLNISDNNSYTASLYTGPWGLQGYYPADVKLNLYAYNDLGNKVLVNTKTLTRVIAGNW